MVVLIYHGVPDVHRHCSTSLDLFKKDMKYLKESGCVVIALAGLVAITPAAGNVGVMGSMGVGAGAGVLTFLAVRYRHKLKIDDALEVFAVHGVGGIWGALATGIFAASGAGLVDGEVDIFWANLRATLATIAYSGLMTFVILKALDYAPGLGLRADEREEDSGLDVSFHGERAYVSDGAD